MLKSKIFSKSDYDKLKNDFGIQKLNNEPTKDMMTFKKTKSGIIYIEPEEFLNAHKHFQANFIDFRWPTEYDKGHLKNSKNAFHVLTKLYPIYIEARKKRQKEFGDEIDTNNFSEDYDIDQYTFNSMEVPFETLKEIATLDFERALDYVENIQDVQNLQEKRIYTFYLSLMKKKETNATSYTCGEVMTVIYLSWLKAIFRHLEYIFENIANIEAHPEFIQSFNESSQFLVFCEFSQKRSIQFREFFALLYPKYADRICVLAGGYSALYSTFLLKVIEGPHASRDFEKHARKAQKIFEPDDTLSSALVTYYQEEREGEQKVYMLKKGKTRFEQITKTKQINNANSSSFAASSSSSVVSEPDAFTDKDYYYVSEFNFWMEKMQNAFGRITYILHKKKPRAMISRYRSENTENTRKKLFAVSTPPSQEGEKTSTTTPKVASLIFDSDYSDSDILSSSSSSSSNDGNDDNGVLSFSDSDDDDNVNDDDVSESYLGKSNTPKRERVPFTPPHNDGGRSVLESSSASKKQKVGEGPLSSLFNIFGD